MFEKLKDKFSKIIKRKPVKKIAHEEGGKIYRTWLFILPVLCGFALGRLASIILGFVLGSFTTNAGIVDVPAAKFDARSAKIENQRGLEGFLAANPFNISPVAAKDENLIEDETEEKEAEIPDTGLKDLILRGTLPGVGAWVENKEKLILLLVGKDIENYKLTSVTYTEANFRRGQNSVTKFITNSPVLVIIH